MIFINKCVCLTNKAGEIFNNCDYNYNIISFLKTLYIYFNIKKQPF